LIGGIFIYEVYRKVSREVYSKVSRKVSREVYSKVSRKVSREVYSKVSRKVIARFLVEGSRISQNILCVGIQEFYFGIIIFYFFHTNLFLEFENLET
jgi:hypothetical protein